VTVQGVVRGIQWANPHVYVFLETRDRDGRVKEYTVECASVVELSGDGWHRNTLKVGDRVTIRMYPLRDGRPGGLFDSAILANGKTMRGD
jgi:hypothetical protein